MEAPNIKFTTKECRVVRQFPFLKEKTAKEIYDDISLTFGEKKSFLFDC